MYRPNSLLLVLPPVVDCTQEKIEVDVDFSHNLRAYLSAFSEVHVMCPKTSTSVTFPQTIPVEDITGFERLRFSILPTPYREDKYFFNKGLVYAKLEREIKSYEYIVISPHAAFDWSTLAGEICISNGIPFDMEADWSLPHARKELWQRMPWGFSKLRKLIWRTVHDRKYLKVLRASSLALLQGADVYHDLSSYASNPHRVLNVQVGTDVHISKEQLARKLNRSAGRRVFQISYAGRVSEVKGPYLWIEAIARLKALGCTFKATWAGEGEELLQARQIVAQLGLETECSFIGKLDRDAARDLIRSSDVFLFCHLVKESPRCLVEALALGTPIVGFDGRYARGLVESEGGGVFVDLGAVADLANAVKRLIDNPFAWRALVESAAASGRALEREAAIGERIALIKSHLQRERQHYSNNEIPT